MEMFPHSRGFLHSESDQTQPTYKYLYFNFHKYLYPVIQRLLYLNLTSIVQYDELQNSGSACSRFHFRYRFNTAPIENNNRCTNYYRGLVVTDRD